MIRSFGLRSTKRYAGAAVEAAVVLPVLLTFVVGIIDIGRLGKISDSLSNAARNGAQYGSTSATAAADTANIRKAAFTEMAGLPNVTAHNAASPNPTVTSSVVTVSGQDYVQVTVTYNMTGTSIFPFYPVNSMSRTVKMPMMPD